MEYLTSTYSQEELAWVTPEIPLRRDIYLMVTLQAPGKLVLRQRLPDGTMPRAPVRRHKDMRCFLLRVTALPDTIALQLFTSTQPKEIKYAYI